MVSCCVLNCCSRSGSFRKGMFSIPGVITNQCDKTRLLSERRRALWLARINRANLRDKDVTKSTKVCARHFISGKPSRLFEHTSPDWAPSINLGYCLDTSKATGAIITAQNKKSRGKRKKKGSVCCEEEINKESEILIKIDPFRHRGNKYRKVLGLRTDFTYWNSNGEFSCQCPEVLYKDASTQTEQEEHSSDHSYSLIHSTKVSRGVQVNILRNSKRLLKCPLCSFSSKLRGLLFRHALFHTGAKPFTCVRCSKKFSLPEVLLQHLERHSFRRPFRCRQCKLSFRSKLWMLHHMVRKYMETLILCFYCGKNFSSICQYNKHCEKRFLRQLCHVDTKEYCDVIEDSDLCSSTVELFNLRECFSICRTPNQVEVKFGNVTSVRKDHNTKSQKDSVQQKSVCDIYQCILCGVNCSSPALFNYHIDIYHKAVDSLKCISCSQMFSVKEMHQFVEHNCVK